MMTCRKCGYRNDFLKKCPFHESPVSERIKAIRERKNNELSEKDRQAILGETKGE